MTKLVGILNITPDSFSDGGNFFAPEKALAHIGQLLEEGADVIDIGAESTKPGAIPIHWQEEWERLSPVLSQRGHFGKAIFSIDTRHAEVAERALDLGADWINDVSGFKDEAMIAAVKNAACPLVVMHSLSVPADRSLVMDEEIDVIEAILAFARERINTLRGMGIKSERIIFDPGIGFGKTLEQNWRILKNINIFHTLDVPIFIGHSRKKFLGEQPDDATLAASCYLARQGVDYLRVHDVAAHRRMLDNIDSLT